MGRAYVFINDQMQGDSTIKSRLGANNKFNTLNIHIRNRLVMPGELIIVPDNSPPIMHPRRSRADARGPACQPSGQSLLAGR